MENLCPTPNEAITTVTAGVDGGLAGSIVRLASEESICEQCGTDLDELREELTDEDEEDVAEAVRDCTLHDPSFDPDNYKTWPRGYMGTLIDRAMNLKD